MFLLEVAALEGVDDLVLVVVEAQGDDVVGVGHVVDVVFGGAPVCEVVFFADLVEGVADSVPGEAMEYGERGVAFH